MPRGGARRRVGVATAGQRPDVLQGGHAQAWGDWCTTRWVMVGEGDVRPHLAISAGQVHRMALRSRDAPWDASGVPPVVANYLVRDSAGEHSETNRAGVQRGTAKWCTHDDVCL